MPSRDRICSIDDCSNRTVARGWCSAHYQRWFKYGDPKKIKPRAGNSTPRTVPSVRTCTTCGFTGESSQFGHLRNKCKPCLVAYKEQWKKDNPERFQAILQRGAEVRRRYELRRRAARNGQDPDFVEKYHSEHDGRCEICGHTPGEGEKDLHIDHDHSSGQFRGLLCNSCNIGLGRFKDSVGNLAAAIRYLERPTPAASAAASLPMAASPADLFNLLGREEAQR